ncbi:MAG: F0F1 ATP synthase subunit gamma [Acidimicrobiia bacterium]|nr:F0F1 ATP synthase subunit gamma [Acidimicrobiia bacterium]MXY73889.1 F0F1 ATP synthase subunit gamma [Acidimicrobiia bacterium]MYB79962.1 F0F1 ATP synthase subunit gamma [Acidimicrobiia bacterium]MYD41384.1 F0F1 ATP synthase subunit gamma [Acidimicrobiia bacterium]MYG92011.1 F0F1 ATP synthase subunit gamma [Acidimicrobiia bacterium]
MASAELRIIRRRIASVSATRKITRAMELIAASRIVKAQQRVLQSRPYVSSLIEVISNVGRDAGGSGHLLSEVRDVSTVGIVVISSDRGLAGAYNSNLIRMAERAIGHHTLEGRDTRLFVIGKKAQSYLRFRGYRIDQTFLGLTDRPDYGHARAVANLVIESYVSGEVDAVEVFYTDYRSVLYQIPTRVELLPVQPPTDADAQEGRSVSYSYEPSAEEILSRILPRYVEAAIFGFLLESSASEHASRQRAMKAATDNAAELTKVLTRVANQARQAEITTEISEIVGGAEALMASDR